MAGEKTERFTEEWALLDVYYGVSVKAGFEFNTGWIDMGNCHRVVIVIDPVSLNDDLYIDVEQATDSSGTGRKSVDNNLKDILVDAIDTAPSAIEIQMEEMDISNRFNFLNIEMTTDNTQGGSNYYVVTVYGLWRFGAPSTSNWDSVTD